MKRNKVLWSLLTLVILMLSGEISLAQCAMCKATVESNVANQSGVGNALNPGILYLMSFPYIIISLVAFFWYKSSKKDSEKQHRMMAFLRRKLS